VTNFVKQFAVCLALIMKLMKINAKVLELVLECTKSELSYKGWQFRTKNLTCNMHVEPNLAE
jgi:hypothetical protein